MNGIITIESSNPRVLESSSTVRDFINLMKPGVMSLVVFTGMAGMLLKRRTPQNIVIGGAAGAFPPMIK